MRKVLLIGNPNCGKTTLFNMLTTSTERVGNWPGVTVEKKQGICEINNQKLAIIDLPGVYSLNVNNTSSQDSIITAEEVVKSDVALIVNVVDACHLERNLYLTTQLLELKVPLILVVNMVDLANKRSIHINQELLSKKLDCPVVFMQANKNLGIENLYDYFTQSTLKPSCFKLNFGVEVSKIINAIESNNNTYFKACRQLESMENHFDYPQDLDILMADTRYTAIHEIINIVQQQNGMRGETITAKIDKFLLNRFFALPIFFGIMYLMFVFSINLGGVFRDFFDIATNAIFIKGQAYMLTKLHLPTWIISILAYGLGRGINTTASFIPIIFIMYLCLSLLEASGYMSRAAFVVDRIMRTLGLPGKAFVPMIVGFGCNVPGIMAARTLESARDRILTILMTPFMSCSARLAIYVVFVSVFFPRGGQNIVFSLYLTGILMAVITGYILKKTLLTGATAPMIIELPTYQMPKLSFLCRDAYKRLRVFLIKAGKLIIPICMILSIIDNCAFAIDGEKLSIVAYLGKMLVPLFKPMGITDDNWPAVVGLLTGTLAKEVMVGTLNSLYSHIAQFNQTFEIYDFNLWQEIKLAFASLYNNIVNFSETFNNPILASANQVNLSNNSYRVMLESFHSKAAAYAYLLFVLLYIPCVSTMAAIKQEANRKYMLFSIFWSLVLAYVVATCFYQVSNLNISTVRSPILYMLALLAFITVNIIRRKRYVVPNA